MCGIAGFRSIGAQLAPDSLRRIAQAMTATLAHRGPDDADLWIDAEAGLALGHRRLSIIDLSAAGRQPMASACGRYVITYNGEIYNFRELRAELEQHGHAFRGHSDTEVLLAALVQWGVVEALGRLNGMFAFALWDRQQRRLTLARDRAGKKPLYYGWCGDSFLFGSELKALRAHPAFDASIDRDALGLLIQYSWMPAPYSIYAGIRQLPAGTLLTVDADDRAGRRRAGGLLVGARGRGARRAGTLRNVARGGDRCARGGAARCGRVPHDRRRQPRRFSVRRDRFQRRGGADAVGELQAGADLLDRLSRGEVQRGRARQGDRAASADRPHRALRDARRLPGGHPPASHALRRAVRRLLADPDLPGLAPGPQQGHGRVVGRWRRRAVRRLQRLRQEPARLAAAAEPSGGTARPRCGAAWRAC